MFKKTFSNSSAVDLRDWQKMLDLMLDTGWKLHSAQLINLDVNRYSPLLNGNYKVFYTFLKEAEVDVDNNKVL